MPNITFGPNLNSVPSPQQQATTGNYIDFTSTAANSANWGQQYLPDLMDKEAEVFGPRTISGFLSQVGAEEAMTSDQVIWSEQGRLHISVKGNLTAAGTIAGSNGGLFTVTSDIDGNILADGFGSAATGDQHGVRTFDTVLVSGNNATVQCLVTEVNGAQIELEPYGAADCAAIGDIADGTCTLLVYGSEFGKGTGYNAVGAAATTESRTANEPTFKTFTNKPIIIKDYYEVSGSDASRIGWIEVASEMGASGYLWYLKSESDTRARFNDYLEMAMIEGVTGDDASVAVDADAFLGMNGLKFGTEGLFAAIEDRGHLTAGILGVNANDDLAEFDAILSEFDKQGAIEENMIFCNRSSSLAIDDMLASMNGYYAGGTSYGVFDNSEDMALNLGFSGFRRGSYDFYKSDFRYLNDRATRGGINETAGTSAIRGLFIPAGTSTVYDQQLGKNIKRPFLHVRYRASQTDDRRMKTWVTGSVGAATSALDAMQLHFLSERCLVVQGANNFMLMK